MNEILSNVIDDLWAAKDFAESYSAKILEISKYSSQIGDWSQLSPQALFNLQTAMEGHFVMMRGFFNENSSAMGNAISSLSELRDMDSEETD